MGQKFGDLDRYYDPGLTLTVRGKEYVLPLPSAELGLWCRRLMETAGEITSASTAEEIQAAADRINELPELPGNLSMEERLLGPVYQQMMTDGVPDHFLQFCATTAYFWIVGGEGLAERYWTSGGRPEAPGPVPNRADRRNARKTGTAEATGTPTPGSTSGTSSRPRSGSSGRGRGSRGRRS